MASPDDLALLQRIVRDRDQAAFQELFERLKGEAYALAVRLAGQPAEGEEALQEAFFDVWRLGSFSVVEPGKVRNFVLGIVAHKALKRGARRWRHRAEPSPVNRTRVTAGPAAAAPQPPETAERRELLSALDHLLERLPEQERWLLALRFGGGLSQQQIGAELGVSQRTVSNRIQKALDFLKSELSGAGLGAGAPWVALEAALAGRFRGGLETPAGLATRLFQRLEEPQGGLPAAVGIHGSTLRIGAWIALPAGLLAGLACWLAVFPPSGPSRGTGTGAAPIQAAQGRLEAPLDGPAKGVRYHWSFKDGPSNALEIIFGTPHLLPGAGLVIPPLPGGKSAAPGGGQGSAAGRIAVIALLKQKFPARPCVLRVAFRAGQTGMAGECSAMWARRSNACNFRKLFGQGIPMPKGLNVFEFWLLDQVQWVFDCSPEYEGRPFLDRLLSIGVYDRPFPSEHLGLLMSNIVLEALDYRELTPAERSALPRDIPAFLESNQARNLLFRPAPSLPAK